MRLIRQLLAPAPAPLGPAPRAPPPAPALPTGALAAVSPASARIGVVLLHGNLAGGLQFSPMVGVFEEAGFGLETPDMGWSDRRPYDKPPLDCMADVDRAVGRLK